MWPIDALGRPRPITSSQASQRPDVIQSDISMESHSDEVSHDEFDRYVRVLADSLSRGHEVVRQAIIGFMHDKGYSMASSASATSAFNPFEIRRGDEAEKLMVEITLQKMEKTFKVSYRSQAVVLPISGSAGVCSTPRSLAAWQPMAATFPLSPGKRRQAPQGAGAGMVLRGGMAPKWNTAAAANARYIPLVVHTGGAGTGHSTYSSTWSGTLASSTGMSGELTDRSSSVMSLATTAATSTGLQSGNTKFHEQDEAALIRAKLGEILNSQGGSSESSPTSPMRASVASVWPDTGGAAVAAVSATEDGVIAADMTLLPGKVSDLFKDIAKGGRGDGRVGEMARRMKDAQLELLQEAKAGRSAKAKSPSRVGLAAAAAAAVSRRSGRGGSPRRRANSANRAGGVQLRSAAMPAPSAAVPSGGPSSGPPASSSSGRASSAGPSRRSRSQGPPAGVRSSSQGVSPSRYSSTVSYSGLDCFALQTAVEQGVAAAIEGETLLLEKHRHQRAQFRTREWLKAALHQQVAAYRQELEDEADWQERELKRLAVLEEQQQAFEEALQEKRAANEVRHELTAEHRAEILRQTCENQEAKAVQERVREERFEAYKAEKQEQAQYCAAVLEQKRREAYDEATRLMEERRQSLATIARSKEVKQEVIANERRSLWESRRVSNEQAARTVERLQEAIALQRVSGRLDANAINNLAEELLGKKACGQNDAAELQSS